MSYTRRGKLIASISQVAREAVAPWGEILKAKEMLESEDGLSQVHLDRWIETMKDYAESMDPRDKGESLAIEHCRLLAEVLQVAPLKKIR